MPRPTKAAGSVALVTGANRGIGLAFVRELAPARCPSPTASRAKSRSGPLWRDPAGLGDGEVQQ
jgi:NAD(P)-dependent dehydrogenase (short-subunit alcohol dehydrogenase family)